MSTISAEKAVDKSKSQLSISSRSPEPVNIWAKVLSEVRLGLVSSVVVEAALFPVDVVKLQLQIHGGGPVEILKQVVSQQGIFGLYRGLWGRLIQTITSNVGFFIWQTLFMQFATQKVADDEQVPRKLGSLACLLINMFAQQVNRVLTTPVDVVANVNQSDPNSRGFFRTFAHVARTGGRPALWRGLGVTLLLSFNPALMFTLVGKITTLVQNMRGDAEGHLGASDMFWISGFSKIVATLVTYPLIRAKAVVQSSLDGPATGLFSMLATIYQKEGMASLYQGVWIMSFKTVLFNSLMMSLKQKLTIIDQKRQEVKKRHRDSLLLDGDWREKVVRVNGSVAPWEAGVEAAGTVVYVDGSWSFLHEAQEHILREAAGRGSYLVVGVHSDSVHNNALGAYPKECFAARVARIHAHPLVSAVLEEAPWKVGEDVVHQLGISKVVSGSITKLADGASPDAVSKVVSLDDPYSACKRLGIFEEIPSLNDGTEHGVWMEQAARVLFSNVDASIDWRILVNNSEKSTWGKNPGYSPRGRSISEIPTRARSASPTRPSAMGNFVRRTSE